MYIFTRHTPKILTLIVLAACSEEAMVERDRSAPISCSEVEALALAAGGETISAFLRQEPDEGQDRGLVVLDGYPPNRDSDFLGVGKAACEAGWSTLYIHYRGTWESEGQLDMDNLVEDALAAADYLRARQMRPIAIVGHSLGGYVSLMAGARDPDLACVVSLAGPDHGVLGRQLAANADMRKFFHDALASAAGPDQPVHTIDVEVLIADIVDRATEFDLRMQAGRLAPKRLLLVAANQDQAVPRAEHHDPLVETLNRAGADNLVSETLEADHNFTGLHADVRALVTDWLNSRCLS